MERKLQEILKKDCLHASYLDRFSLDFDLPNVTAIIPTFNRSPHPLEEDSNPLAWCLESLLTQKSSGLDEIIVIDDNSTDTSLTRGRKPSSSESNTHIGGDHTYPIS